MALTEPSPSSLHSLITDLARKHDEDIHHLNQQLSSIHDLLLSMLPLKSDRSNASDEWNSSPIHLSPSNTHHDPSSISLMSHATSTPLHPPIISDPFLNPPPGDHRLSPPLLRMGSASFTLNSNMRDGPVDLHQLRMSLQGAEREAFGASRQLSLSQPIFPPDPRPPHSSIYEHEEDEHFKKESMGGGRGMGRYEEHTDEHTALLVDQPIKASSSNPSVPQPSPLPPSQPMPMGGYSDGDTSLEVSSELRSRVQRNDPGGLRGVLYLIKRVVWGGLLMPHQKNIWDVFICVLLLWVAFGTPVVICFGLKAALWEGHPLGWVEFLVNACFVIDMYLNFRTAYIDKQGNLVTNKKKIATNYLKKWFFIDLISVIPIHLFGGPSWTEFTTLFKLLRVIRIAKIFRMLRAYSNLKGSSEAKRSVIPRLIEWFDMKMDKSLIGIAVAIFTVVIVFHMSACLFFYTAYLQRLSSSTWFGTYMGPNAAEASLFIKYLNSIYWAATTMTTVGYGDIVPKLPGEKIVAIPLMIMGVNLLGYITSSIANIISVRNASQQIVDTKKQMIKAFLKERGIPNQLASRINRFFHYVSMKEVRPDEKQIVQELPPKLRSRVLYHMYREVIEKVPSFKDQHPDLLAMVVSHLRPEYYMTGDVLSCQGDPPEGMYIIGEGSIEARTYEIHDDNDSSLLLAASTDQDLLGWPYELRGVLTQPGFWGHVTALESLPSPVTLIARTFCELFLLPTDDLEEVLERFPEVKDLLLPPAISEAIRTHAHFSSSVNIIRSPARRHQTSKETQEQLLTAKEVESFIIRVDYPSLKPPPTSADNNCSVSEAKMETEGGLGGAAASLSRTSLSSLSVRRSRKTNQADQSYAEMNEKGGYDNEGEWSGQVGQGGRRAMGEGGDEGWEGSFSVRFAPDILKGGTHVEGGDAAQASTPTLDPQVRAGVTSSTPTQDPPPPQASTFGPLSSSLQGGQGGGEMSRSFNLKRNSVRQKNATTSTAGGGNVGGGQDPNDDDDEPSEERAAMTMMMGRMVGELGRPSVESTSQDPPSSPTQKSLPSFARLSRKSISGSSSIRASSSSRAPQPAPLLTYSYGRSTLAAAHSLTASSTSTFQGKSSSLGGYRGRSGVKHLSQRSREDRDSIASSSVEMAVVAASRDSSPPSLLPPPPSSLGPPPPSYLGLGAQQEMTATAGAQQERTATAAAAAAAGGARSPSGLRPLSLASRKRAELLMTPLSSDGEDEGEGKRRDARRTVG